MFNQLDFISEKQIIKLNNLREYISNLKSACIAYSGGVDSSLIATIGYEQLGKNAVAITGVSPALASQLRNEARAQAKWIGIKHIEINTFELEDKSYSTNQIGRAHV